MDARLARQGKLQGDGGGYFFPCSSATRGTTTTTKVLEHRIREFVCQFLKLISELIIT